MRIIKTTHKDFNIVFDKILKRGEIDVEKVQETVKKIVLDVKREGDEALIKYIKMFDGWNPIKKEELVVSKEEIEISYENLSSVLKDYLNIAFERILSYHKKQIPSSWLDFEKNGIVLGQKVTPVSRAGLYIPGGKAAYPSSLLMNAAAAIAAGVENIYVTTPATNGKINSLLLAACHICKISEVYKIGGASAIAAFAYGTDIVKKTEVITGPGNIYVAAAKKLVYGEVNIDMIAGPSEIGIIADESAKSSYIAIDLLSQAEHDEMASSILVTPSYKLAKSVSFEVERLLKKLSRKEIAETSIRNRGYIIVVKDLEEATEIMNKIAPEHLEIVCRNSFEFLPKIKNAGAIFLGSNTPEAIGDYIAGPNHTLPTGGTAKFYSPLSAEHFLKKSSIISFSKKGLEELGEAAKALAQTEGLEAHALSIEKRLQTDN
jgi:histidinol dehydrogenase